MSRTSALKKSSFALSPSLERGRQSFHRQEWANAVSAFQEADSESPLDPPDLALLAQALLLTSRDREGTDILARAHQAFLSHGEAQPAARCAFWVGFIALLNHDLAQASGWLSRAERVLEQHPECVERGYLLLPVGFRFAHSDEPAKGHEAFLKATKIGEQYRDRDLVAMGRQGQGRALIRQGEIARGVALLDEAMAAVMAGEVSPLTAGGIYCSVIEACGEIFDLRRAQEWTAALDRWCSSQPDMVPYHGQCSIRKAEILQLHGAWQDATQHLKQACDRFAQVPRGEAGSAFYRLAELHRLRGDFAAAENAYREAGRWLRTPQAGFALLRFAQGEVSTASAAIRRVLDETHEPGSRARVLESAVEIMIASSDIGAARTAANELTEIARHFEAPQLHAMSMRAEGSVLLAEHDAKAALAALRRAWSIWCELDAPYEAARTRVLMAMACGEMDDCDTGRLELDLACEVFQKLGAAPDLARAQAISIEKTASSDTPLTTREIEVLKLIASGKSNRAIGIKLGISEKTVARHVSNIFNKLDLSSRAAATAFAYKNQLV